MPTVLAVIDDLFFATKVKETARQIGCHVEVRQASVPLEEAVKASPSLIIVDLGCRSADPAAFIARLKAEASTRDIPVVAFGSHVETAALGRAHVAGADRVMARSGFVRDLSALLGEFGSPPIAEGR